MRISDWSSDVCSSDLSVKNEMHMAGSGAIGDHRDRLGRRMRRKRFDLHIEHCRQTAQALRAYPQRLDFFIQGYAQLLELVLRAAGKQFVHVDVVHQRSDEPPSELQSLMRISYAVL